MEILQSTEHRENNADDVGVTRNCRTCDRSVMYTLVQSSLGFTPTLRKHIDQIRQDANTTNWREWLSALFLVILLLVNLFDAFFDMFLSVRTIFHGPTQLRGLGILLCEMTLLGRFITAWYGRKVAAATGGDDQDSIIFLASTETAVFLIEDGASILFIANHEGDKDFVEMMCVSLSAILGLGFCVFFAILAIWRLYLLHLDGTGPLQRLFSITAEEMLDHSLSCIIIGFVIFQVLFLFTEVILKETDNSLSVNKELAAYIIYGIGAFTGCLVFALNAHFY